MSDNNRKAPDNLTPEMARNIKEDLIYGVGYRRPPEDTRFKKGQSGNPKGRPRRQPADVPVAPAPIQAIILEEAKRLVTVREGERTYSVPTKQAIIRAANTVAMKGSPYAMKIALEIIAAAERDEQLEIAKSQLIWSAHKAACEAQIAEAAQRKEPPPRLLPQPDDIIIEPGKPVVFVGPMDETELAGVERDCLFRDTFLLQDVRDRRVWSDTGSSGDEPRTALLMADLMNNALPRRFRLGDTELPMMIIWMEALSDRALLKKLYQQYRSLGVHRKRGWVSPALEVLLRRLTFIVDMREAVQKGDVDLAATARGEFNDVVRALMAKPRETLAQMLPSYVPPERGEGEQPA